MLNERDFRLEEIRGSSPSAPPARPGAPAEHSLGIVERRGADRLFLDYFGLNEQPFGVTPDLRFLYLGAKHRQALDTLNYGTESGRGFLTLIARPGMGKTSLLFQYLENIRDKARTVFLFQTDCDAAGLLRYLLAELGLDGKNMDLPEMRALLSRVLLGEMEAGRQFVLVIDEAQNLDEKVLESIRLLSNFETPWMKLMHIVLAGQPQLADRLSQPSMAQLLQRVSLSARLEPFTREEANLYIDHRLWVAGYKGAPLFSMGARTLVAEQSEGIPRVINNMCFCAMSFACAMKQKSVDRQMMSEVVADMDFGASIEKKEERAARLAAEPRLPEDPKPATAKAVRSKAELTLNAPPYRSWLASLVVAAGITAFVLGWYALQFRVDKRMGVFVKNLPANLKGYVASKPSPAPPLPPPAIAPGAPPSSPAPAELTNSSEPGVPQQAPPQNPTDPALGNVPH